MIRKNIKGFTLIELLAVIVILGVLMVVAIPAMTRYIENSKKDVFADTAKKYISAARYGLLSGEYKCGSIQCDLTDVVRDNAIVVPVSIIEVENDTQKSPWGKKFSGDKAWVAVTSAINDPDKPVYNYYFLGVDDSGNGIPDWTIDSKISRNSVTKGNSIGNSMPEVSVVSSVNTRGTKKTFTAVIATK